jgi:pimeloyl-ACP methyl ester carboxylesterase
MQTAAAVIYVHGKGGSADEAAHYKPLFPDCDVIGFDYSARTPWEAASEFPAFFAAQQKAYASVVLVANSIGAWFSMCAGLDGLIEKARFISPIVDMEGLIRGRMAAQGVTEAELQSRGVIPTAFGEDLSWDYLQYVRTHPIRWNAPTAILYGSADTLTSYKTVAAFAERCGAALTVMENGEHWFHTEEQLRFLDRWILANPRFHA